jgi:translation initiation factor IF-2
MLSPITKEEEVGTVEVRQLFTVGKTTVIAGCMVTSGNITRGAHVRVKRGEKLIYEGRIASLKRFKDDVKEVKNGFECGVVLDDFNELKPHDILTTYKFIHEAATFEVNAE